MSEPKDKEPAIWNDSGGPLPVYITGEPSRASGTFTTPGPIDFPEEGQIAIWIDLNEKPRWWQLWAWPGWLWQRARGGRLESLHYTKVEGLTFTLEAGDPDE